MDSQVARCQTGWRLYPSLYRILYGDPYHTPVPPCLSPSLTGQNRAVVFFSFFQGLQKNAIKTKPCLFEGNTLHCKILPNYFLPVTLFHLIRWFLFFQVWFVMNSLQQRGRLVPLLTQVQGKNKTIFDSGTAEKVLTTGLRCICKKKSTTLSCWSVGMSQCSFYILSDFLGLLNHYLLCS